MAFFNSQSLSLEDAAHILEIIDSVPDLQARVEPCIEEDTEELQYAYLPDPWMLVSEEVVAIAPTATLTTAPCLRLLPPAKPQPQIITLDPVESELLATFMPVVSTTAKHGRPKKEIAPVATTAKRRPGRPRKAV